MSKSLLVMETPKSCSGCKFNSMEDWGNEYCDVQDGNVVIDKYDKTRHPQCPLKQLPNEEEVVKQWEVLESCGTNVNSYGEVNENTILETVGKLINTIYGDEDE